MLPSFVDFKYLVFGNSESNFRSNSMESSSSNQVVPQEEKMWSELSSDVLELIFSNLPEASVLRVASVCKRWYSIAENPTFSDFYRKNQNGNSCNKFVFRGNCVNYAFSEHFDIQEGFRFQPVEKSFNVPTFPCSMDGDVPTIEAAGGVHLAFTGLRETTLQYKLSLVEKNWRATPEMPYLLQDPVVGVVDSRDGSSHELVVAGGSSFYSEDGEDLAVSVYECQTDSWGYCDPLPPDFRGCTSSVFMAGVVHKGRFYVYDTYSGLVTWLDLETKRWSPVANLRDKAKGTQLFLVSRSEALYLVGVQEASTWDLSFTVWNVVDELKETMRLGDIVHNSVILNACGAAPLAIIPRWASSSMKVASSSLSLLSSIVVKALVPLLVQFVIINCQVTRRGVFFLRGLISATVSRTNRRSTLGQF